MTGKRKCRDYAKEATRRRQANTKWLIEEVRWMRAEMRKIHERQEGFLCAIAPRLHELKIEVGRLRRAVVDERRGE